MTLTALLIDIRKHAVIQVPYSYVGVLTTDKQGNQSYGSLLVVGLRVPPLSFS